MTKLKAFFFWPLVMITIGLSAYLIYQQFHTSSASVNSGQEPFDLLLREVVTQTGNIELATVSFEHWQKQSISTSILKPGPLGVLVNQYVPKAVLRRLSDQGWNQSTAEIITSCTASVEFEIPMDDPAWGPISVNGHVATITAPPPVTSSINILPETLRGWVLREDFIIDGEKEKERLLRQLRSKLRTKVDSEAFHAVYREQCRRSLEDFFRALFKHTDSLRQVDHVYVQFTDEAIPSK